MKDTTCRDQQTQGEGRKKEVALSKDSCCGCANETSPVQRNGRESRPFPGKKFRETALGPP